MQSKTLFVLVALCISCTLALAPLYGVGASGAVEGQYIVVLHSNISDQARNAHLTKYKAYIIHDYNMDHFKGYCLKLDKLSLKQLLQHPDVKYIEQDQEVTVAADACLLQHDAVWGLDRIDEQLLNLNGKYNYPDTAGEGVNAYIIDTGIRITHTEFQGRAKWGYNTVGDKQDTDCNGHGTHVAGTVGGLNYGVAKKVTLIAVKVLGCTGSGTWGGVAEGIEWVTKDSKTTGKRSVANMSLGGGVSVVVDDATDASIAAGVVHSIAAGNSNTDACTSSPARVATAITVGATTVDSRSGKGVDARSSFSNYGNCVHILAPGELIKSAWHTSDTATNTISGTSMATPHVCGATALYVAANPTATPAKVKADMITVSTKDSINLLCPVTGVCSRTPNRLLYTGDDCAN